MGLLVTYPIFTLLFTKSPSYNSLWVEACIFVTERYPIRCLLPGCQAVYRTQTRPRKPQILAIRPRWMHLMRSHCGVRDPKAYALAEVVEDRYLQRGSVTNDPPH